MQSQNTERERQGRDLCDLDGQGGWVKLALEEEEEHGLPGNVSCARDSAALGRASAHAAPNAGTLPRCPSRAASASAFDTDVSKRETRSRMRCGALACALSCARVWRQRSPSLALSLETRACQPKSASQAPLRSAAPASSKKPAPNADTGPAPVAGRGGAPQTGLSVAANGVANERGAARGHRRIAAPARTPPARRLALDGTMCPRALLPASRARRRSPANLGTARATT